MKPWPFILTVGLAGELACASSPAVPPVAQADEAAMFGAALSTCVINNNTRATIDACRVAVEQLYCGPGGALASSSGCVRDGGAE
jgi:hypothetical protein